ncbi:MAG: hypothetical protein WD990_08320 [Acidimicrobiia bacterium]
MTTARRPLNALMRLRSLAERRARRDLGEAVMERRDRLGELERRRTEQSTVDVSDAPLSSGQLLGLHLQGVRSRELVAAATTAHAVAEERMQRRRLDWITSRGELDAVENLDERHRFESAERARRATDHSMDDLMALLHVMRAEPRGDSR